MIFLLLGCYQNLSKYNIVNTSPLREDFIFELLYAFTIIDTRDLIDEL